MARTEVPSDPKYDPHFAAIGRVAETWAQLEFHIDTAIWEFAQVEQMFGACITSQLIGVNNRFRALSSLVQARNGSNESVTVMASTRSAGVPPGQVSEATDAKTSVIEVSLTREDVVDCLYQPVPPAVGLPLRDLR